MPPLLWFGAVYLGSLLTLLWQGFYTFDDFTMAVTPDLTFANLAALFNPANYDIILRTLTMAVLVSLASAALAFPIAYYMARYTSGRVKAFFYIAVMMPMWASYIVKAYAWTLLLAKDGVAQWFLQHLGLEPLASAADGARRRRQHAVDLGAGAFSGVRLYLAAVHDPADPGGAGAPASLAAARLGGSGRATGADLPPRHLPLAVPGIAAGSIFTFADAGRLLSCRSWWDRRAISSAAWCTPSRVRSAYADGRGLYAGADRPDRHLPSIVKRLGAFDAL